MAEAVATDWIEWAGGECPVALGDRVETITRGFGPNGICYAESIDWRHRPISRLDIIAYRVVSA